jgi:hypothetical protein
MKIIAHFFCAASILVFSFHPAPAAPATTNQPAGFLLIIELQDGSKIIGKNGDDNFQFRSEVLGEMKLPLERIRSIACRPKTNLVQLAATNGDTLTAQFVTRVVRVETAFGNFKLPVDLIQHLTVSPAGNPGQMRPGLVALWSGEGDGNDSAGGNPATLMGDVSFAEGKVGQAFLLNGFSSGLKISAGPALNVGEGEGLTILAWIKPENLRSANQWLAGWEAGPHVLGSMLKLSQSQSLFGRGTGCLFANLVDVNGASHCFSSTRVLQNNVFQHIALTYDKTSGVAVFYCNGVVVEQQNLGPFTPQTTYRLVVGARPFNDGLENSYAGLLDELAIYNRALPASEIQSICTEENNGEPLPPPTPALPGNAPFQGLNRNFIQN